MEQYTDNVKCFNTLFEKSIKANWERPALTDYQGKTLNYSALACEIEKIHIIYRTIGIKEGDKIALCGRNSSNWAVVFFATLTYGAVAVPILHEFKAEQIRNILSHSEAHLLFANDNIWKEVEDAQIATAIPDFMAAINLSDFSLFYSNNRTIATVFENADDCFKVKHPDGFKPTDIDYVKHPGDELAVLNYTSGSTGKSKGVMLSQKNLWGNVQFAIDHLGDKIARDDTSSVVSILPMAHMYGLAFEILSEICLGMHIYFLTKLSPTIIFKAFSEVRPTIIISVPLIIEKVVRRALMPKFKEPHIKLLLHIPFVSYIVRKQICKKLTNTFGNRFFEVIIGGAALAEDVEQILKSIGFRYTVGYGTTECAPLIAYNHWFQYKLGSCGKPIDRMEVRIDSDDPAHTVGEILVRGDNVMLGYYKNEEITRRTIVDGWYHTGDLGIMDASKSIYIRGRSKNMLLGPNGQNIYPEEIEDKLNSNPLVAECVVIQKADRLYALIYPNSEEAEKQGISNDNLQIELDKIRISTNKELPAYEQIAGIKIMDKEFEKTPKHSIKRFLYFDEKV